MSRHRFYEVPLGAYLFNANPASATAPEEPVRQWCAFELIRAYGFRVADLEFERPVKVGSKTYRIDVLVKRNGVPWIVVECKERKFTKAADGLAQAISYADARSIQAEFAVYTNGTDWHVRRNLQAEWVTVPDLPARPMNEAARPFLEILTAMDALGPLVWKLDDAVSGIEARAFFEAMQKFFCGQNLLTRNANEMLVHATDNLLRVLSVENADERYEWGKLGAAQRDWERYRKYLGSTEGEIGEVGGGFWAGELSRLRLQIERIIRSAPKPHSCDILLLRLDIALLDYGDKAARNRERFLPIGPNVHHALRDFLDFGLTVHFDTHLPDPIDIHEMSDVKRYCRSA